MKAAEKQIPTPKGLKGILEEQRWKQHHVAQWAGITQGGISRWMNGKQDIRLGQALTIAKKLGVSIEEIMEGPREEAANETAGTPS